MPPPPVPLSHFGGARCNLSARPSNIRHGCSRRCLPPPVIRAVSIVATPVVDAAAGTDPPVFCPGRQIRPPDSFDLPSSSLSSSSLLTVSSSIPFVSLLRCCPDLGNDADDDAVSAASTATMTAPRGLLPPGLGVTLSLHHFALHLLLVIADVIVVISAPPANAALLPPAAIVTSI